MELSPLTIQVQGLSLGALELLIQTLLAREGFGETELLNRWKSTQKSKKGGFELMCTRGFGPIQETFLVKVIQDDIRVRQIVEMAGNVDRMNATHGIVVTTTRACRTTLQELPKITKSPVFIMEPNDLTTLMIQHKVGVRAWGEPNFAFFSFLEERAKELEACYATKKPSNKPSSKSRD